MNLGVIGTGRLGLSFALLCAQKGFTVTASDKDTEYVEKLQTGTHRTSEPFIEGWLDDTSVTKNIIFTDSNRTVVSNSDIIFLFVPTPSLPTGEYDHQYIEDAIDSIADIDCRDKILVIGCTVMPGYTQSLIDRTDYDIVYNPEFIAQGAIVNGLRNADMILIGTHKEASVHALTALYRAIMNQYNIKVNVMSPTAAELTKISINCFLTTKIAFRNMIGEIAINSGIEDEVNTIIGAIGSDSRIGTKYLLYYGFGYGGVCLPRDNKALIAHARLVGNIARVAEGTEAANCLHHSYLKEYFINKNPNKKIPFIFNQLSYKKGVDILTESQQYLLCKDLLKEGYSVVINEGDQVVSIVMKELAEYQDRILFNKEVTGILIDFPA